MKLLKKVFVFSLVLLIVSVIVILFVPSGKQTNLTEKVQALKNLSELATAEYHVTKIVKYNDNNFFGDKKILFETSAVLKAGVDLKDLKDSDFIISHDTISLFLPPPVLLSLDMQLDSIKEKFVKTDVLRTSFSNKDKDVILAAGEKSIRDNLATIGILDAARTNTRTFLETWLRLTGFTYINIYFREAEIQKPLNDTIS